MKISTRIHQAPGGKSILCYVERSPGHTTEPNVNTG